MPLSIPTGFAQASIVFTGNQGTQPFVTTLGVDVSGFGGDFVAAANAVKSAYASSMASVTSPTCVLDRVSLLVGQDGPNGSVDSDEAPDVMTGTGVFGPMAMAVIGRKVTNQLGRAGRGRMFLPGVNSEGGIEPDGSLTTGYRTAINTALAAFYTDLTTGPEPTPPFLLHNPTINLTPTPITNFVVSDLVGWIRGRIR